MAKKTMKESVEKLRRNSGIESNRTKRVRLVTNKYQAKKKKKNEYE
jgi:hypothetical protein